MKKIPFVKMHGLGNDFVIIAEEMLPPAINMQNFAQRISDRRLGIGCDQFITYKEDNDFVKMSIFNRDGSKAKACGNASRCLSRLIFEKSKKSNITLDIDGRKVLCAYSNEDEIKVDLGTVSFEESWMLQKEVLWDLAMRHLIEPKEMLCVDVANPHLVIFSKLSDQDKGIIGKNFQNPDLFKEGVNVSFAQIKDDKIYLKVWERGTGFTYACGSGAIATFAAANKLGFVGDDAEVIFELGTLKMQKVGANIAMTGPASFVFEGEYFYE
jgi:diaminopimelate epimerase